MKGDLLGWLLVAPLLGALVCVLPVRGEEKASRLAGLGRILGYGGVVLAAGAALGLTRPGPTLLSQAGGWAPPWGVSLRLGAWEAWAVVGSALLFAAVSPGTDRDASRRMALRLMLFSAALAALLVGDAFTRLLTLAVASWAWAGLWREEGKAGSAGFDVLVRTSVGIILLLLGTGFYFVRTGSFELAGWAERLASGTPFPGAGAACLLMLVGGWILAGLYPAPHWQGEAWGESPWGMPEKIWFPRWALWVLADTLRQASALPSGWEAARVWEASRWVAWVAFAGLLFLSQRSGDDRRALGRLDAAALALLWALSAAPGAALAVAVVSQSFALVLLSAAPPARRSAGLWLLRLALGVLLPAWGCLRFLPTGGALSHGVEIALGALAFSAIRIGKPFPAGELHGPQGEAPFWGVFVAAAGTFLLAAWV